MSKICWIAGFDSDHSAIFTELVLDTDNNVQQSGLEAKEDDIAWAKDKADDQEYTRWKQGVLWWFSDQFPAEERRQKLSLIT